MVFQIPVTFRIFVIALLETTTFYSTKVPLIGIAFQDTYSCMDNLAINTHTLGFCNSKDIIRILGHNRKCFYHCKYEFTWCIISVRIGSGSGRQIASSISNSTDCNSIFSCSTWGDNMESSNMGACLLVLRWTVVSTQPQPTLSSPPVGCSSTPTVRKLLYPCMSIIILYLHSFNHHNKAISTTIIRQFQPP